MKNIKKYKLVHETPAHFIMHDGQAHFHIAKKGLDKEIIGKIQGFADGGEVEEQVKKMKRLQQKEGRLTSQDFSDGGKAKSNEDEEGDILNKFEKSIRSAFGVKEEAPAQTEEETREQEYERIRRQNLRNVHGQPFFEGGFAEAAQSIKSAFGGEAPHKETLEEKNQKIREQNLKNVHGDHYSDGGEVEEKLKKLKKAQQKEGRITEQDIQSYEEGGFVEKLQAAKDALLGKIPELFSGASDQIQSPSLDPAIQTEQQRLAVNSGMPGAINPIPGIEQPSTAPVNIEPFKTEAETNVAKNFVAQQQAAKMEQQLLEQEKIAQIQKTMSDNAARAAAGLPQLPVPQLQPSQQQIQQPIAIGEQISLVPRKMEASASGGPKSFNAAEEFERGSKLQQAGILGKARAEEQSGREQQALLGKFVEQEKERQQAYDSHLNEIDRQNETLRQDILSRKIDPNRMWNDMSTGSKIAAGLGMLFSGLGSGMSGQPNIAVGFIQKAVDNDIEAQKADASNSTSMYRMGLERYRNEQSAAEFARLQAHQILSAEVQRTAAKLGTANAQNTANILLGELAKADAPIKQNLAIQGAALSLVNQPSSSGPESVSQSGINPNKIRAMAVAGLLPKEELPKVMNEYGEYMKAKDLLDRTEQVFRDAAKLSTYTERFAQGIPGGSMIPTVRESTKQYKALSESYLDKITKDLTGRVTPESIRLLHGSIPVAGDSAETVKLKETNMKDIIKGAYAYPTMITYGIVNPKDPVISTSQEAKQRFTVGKPKGK